METAVSPQEIDNARRERAADSIYEYARFKNFRTRTSENAAYILLYLRKNNISRDDLEPLLDMLILKDKRLLPWFISQARDNTTRQKEFKAWLIANGFVATRMIDYFELDPTDTDAFAYGFAFGVAKSLTYDNIKGIYDLLKLGVDVHMLITEYETEFITNLSSAYKKQLDSSIGRSAASISDFNQKIVGMLINNKRNPQFDQASALGQLLEENRQILIHFLYDPFANVLDKESFKVFDMFYQRLDKLMLEDDKITKVWEFVKQVLYKETNRKVDEKLADYRFFEAGLIAGNGYADTAQILAGLILVAWAAGKFAMKNIKLLSGRLLKLSASQRAVLTTFVIALSNIQDSRLIVMDMQYLPVMLEGNPKAALVEDAISKIDDAEEMFVKVDDVEVMSNDTAKEISGHTNVPLPAGCSTAPGGSLVMGAFGIFLLLRNKKNNGILTMLAKDTKEKLKAAFLNGKYQFMAPFEPAPFFKKMAVELKIKDFHLLGRSTIVKEYVDVTVRAFELAVAKKQIKVTSKGVYSTFNNYLNRRLVKIAEAVEKEGHPMLILIDEKLETGFGKVLDTGVEKTFNNRTFKIRELFDMNIFEFYKKFYNDNKLEELYNKYIDLLKSKEPELFEKRQMLLESIYEEKNSELRELMFVEYEVLTNDLNKAISKHKIVFPSKRLESFIFGKLNPYGKCGNARPDFLVADFEGTRIVLDFLHIPLGGKPNHAHLVGTDFYQDFNRVIIGPGEAAKIITADIPYTFTKKY